jgi:hypothetical protein
MIDCMCGFQSEGIFGRKPVFEAGMRKDLLYDELLICIVKLPGRMACRSTRAGPWPFRCRLEFPAGQQPLALRHSQG